MANIFISMKKKLDDIVTAGSFIYMGDFTRENHYGSQVWVDYYFIAACYTASAGRMKKKMILLEKILEYFPNYDPSARLREESISTHTRPEAAQLMGHAMNMLNMFRSKHPDFSFETAFGDHLQMKYWAAASKNP